jgi:hypothetical protein
MNRLQIIVFVFLVANHNFIDECFGRLRNYHLPVNFQSDFIENVVSAPNIKICSRNDPNIAKCIIESVSLLQPRLGNGILGPDFRIIVSKNHP